MKYIKQSWSCQRNAEKKEEPGQSTKWMNAVIQKSAMIIPVQTQGEWPYDSGSQLKWTVQLYENIFNNHIYIQSYMINS